MNKIYYSFLTLLFLGHFQITFAQCPAVGDLVITEFMPNPMAVSDTDGEYIEVYNSTDADIDMDGLTISDDNNTFNVNGSFIVPAKSYAVFVRNGDSVENGGISGTVYDYPNTFSLVSDSFIKIECDNNGTMITIDEVIYDANFPFGNGISASLDPSKLTKDDNDNANNWCPGETTYGDGDLGTPGAENDACLLACPAVGSLVITEFLADASGADENKEYIEIYNSSNDPIDLNGFVLSDDDSDEHTINTSLIVAAGDYVVLGQSNVLADNGGVTVDYVYSGFNLGNSSSTDPIDEIIISCNNTELDRVDYTSSFPIEEGESTSLNPDNLTATDNDTGSNWCLATSEIMTDGDLGTPGTANDVCPEPMCAITNVSTTNARCDGTDYLFDVAFDVSNGGGNYEVIDITNGDAQLATGSTSPITVTIPNNTSTTDFQITVRDVATTTCVGNNQTVTPLDCSVVITCPNVGDLVITEIMQDPSAVADNAGEYFEIYNTTSSPIDLLQFILKDDGGSSHTIPTSVEIAANSYAVLGINNDMTTNGGVTVDYQYSDYNLTNADDEVVLECKNVVIDRVAYDGGTNFPDPTGASMQLASGSINATDNDDGANWCVSTAEIMTGGDKGTPGAINGDCVVLAVEWIDFSGHVNKEGVFLKWQTATETNHNRYIIEHSIDGIAFAEIGQQKGQNIDNQLTNYNFTHAYPAKGNNFYRLRALDFSGKSTFSKVIQIEVNAAGKIMLFPNPASNQLILSGNINPNSNYQIINQLGQVIQTTSVLTDKQINIATLPTGVYYLKINTENTSSLQRFVKK